MKIKTIFKFVLSSLLLLTFSSSAWSQIQDSIYQLLAEIPIASHSFTTDQLQQLYIATPENEIIKYSPDGKVLFRYNNNTLGEIGFIDASNPLNVLVYYPDFKTVINLDRTLNESGQINLFDLGVIDVNGIGRSSDNNLWLYDNTAFKLKKINRQGQTQIESDDLSLLLRKFLQPNCIKEVETLVYVNDPEHGIFIFDFYGQYMKLLAIKGLSDFQIVNEQLIYQQEGELHVFHLRTLLDRTVKLPKAIEEGDQLRIEKDKLYWGDTESIKVFQF